MAEDFRAAERAKPKAAKHGKAIRLYPLEADEQKLFVAWARAQGYTVVAGNNGAHLAGRTPGERARQWGKLYALGAVQGWPDVEVLLKAGPRVFLEFKRQRLSYGSGAACERAVSAGQRGMHDTLRRKGHEVLVAYGADDAIRQFCDYGGLR